MSIRSAGSANHTGVKPMRVGVLYSRIRVEEKLILAELERRGIAYDLIDVRHLSFDLHRPALQHRPAGDRAEQCGHPGRHGCAHAAQGGVPPPRVRR